MARFLQGLILVLHLMVMGSVITIVALTRYLPQNRRLLLQVTKESGVFELGTSAVLVLISLVCLTLLVRGRMDRTLKWALAAIGGLAFLAAMEELSWGQHLFGFQAGDFFMTHNRQRETNLHNLISAELFGFLTNAGFYLLFVFGPLLLRFRSGKAGRLIIPEEFIPPVPNILIFCFAFSLQAYFRKETAADTLALLFALGLLTVLMIRRRRYRSVLNRVHLMVIIGATGFFMHCHPVFRYANTQYEIREFVFAYGLLFWMFHWSGRRMEKSAGAERNTEGAGQGLERIM